LSFPLTFCDGELHLGCRDFSNSREISGSLMQVRARVVNYLSGVIGPLLYMNWMYETRYLNALSTVEVCRVSCSHASDKSHSRTAQIAGGFFCWPEFHWNTLDGKSSTGRISKNLLAIPRSRIRYASNNSDAKSLTQEGVSEVIPNLSMSMSDGCPLSASSIAVGIIGTGKQQFHRLLE